ncbi:transcriptional antiterminator [Pseudoalteromonas luteoviolacea]|uniref:Transcriptional antiterminator n=1 Tax=Pseudoalteromonas luteoviolacea TaxID=43657 RepID=A0A0C1MFF3_9GAMM|nr:heteromeric transposase endonuclease subunit TnsA [Pseudoalteromonas luteoviolacea]KID55524.1 transcriptional antiterminator [Pseudoalteromonas luteoviolacea]
MSRKIGHTEAQYRKWIKEGRGSGEYREYKPWLTVYDSPSDGRVHRVFGYKTKRTHHLLSDLELSMFYLLEWRKEVLQIKEQFPLERDLTAELVKSAGIKHPSVRGVNQYMSSDFLVETSSTELPYFALQVKYTNALEEQRKIEILELERRYWLEKNIPWQIVTEAEIPKVVKTNIEWIYPMQGAYEEAPHSAVDQALFYADYFSKYPTKTLIEACKEIDTAYGLDLGESLYEIRCLLADRYFTFDIFKPVQKVHVGDFKLGDVGIIQEAFRVSNQ